MGRQTVCGIFGIAAGASGASDHARLRQGIWTLFRLSERRGREAAGLAVAVGGRIDVYKRPMAPGAMLASADFNRFFDQCHLAGSGAGATRHRPIALIGHCRLATNGSEALAEHNQPVVSEASVGVHNGIVTNAAALAKASGLTQAGSALDSQTLFRLIDVKAAELGLTAGIGGVFAEIEGEASVALLRRDGESLALASNCGALYWAEQGDLLVFASEQAILAAALHAMGLGRDVKIHQIAPGHGVLRSLAIPPARTFSLTGRMEAADPARLSPFAQVFDWHETRRAELRRCSSCLLPETYPFIAFDEAGMCSLCHGPQPKPPLGRPALEAQLARHRRGDGRPDCIVALSGGRDSSYGLHVLKREFGMNPIAFSYDWGLVTDLARRNQARMCGQLGVEHVLRVADLGRQRRHVRQNIEAWLARPQLGMIPLFMAGDKFFYDHARALRAETGIPLVVFCAGNPLESTSFKTGFAGVRENDYRNRLFGLATAKKLQLAAYYAGQCLLNPRYLNNSLGNSLRAFRSTFVAEDDFLYLYDYLPWDEAVIERTLIEGYNWETVPGVANTWRIGDGYTAFINFIYLSVAGFSEFDVFRSNQIRAGLIDRETALRLVAADNRPRLAELQAFAQLIGINLEEVLAAIERIPKLHGRGPRDSRAQPRSPSLSPDATGKPAYHGENSQAA